MDLADAMVVRAIAVVRVVWFGRVHRGRREVCYFASHVRNDTCHMSHVGMSLAGLGEPR